MALALALIPQGLGLGLDLVTCVLDLGLGLGSQVLVNITDHCSQLNVPISNNVKEFYYDMVSPEFDRAGSDSQFHTIKRFSSIRGRDARYACISSLIKIFDYIT